MNFVLYNEPHLFQKILSFFETREFYPIIETSKTFQNLVKIGNYKIHSPYYSDVCNTFEMIIWASTHPNFKFVTKLSWFIGMKGDFKLFQFIMDNNCQIDKTTCYNIAFEGHFDLLKWVLDHLVIVPPIFISFIYMGASQGGFLNILKYIESYENQRNIKTKADSIKIILDNACFHGYFDIINWVFNFHTELATRYSCSAFISSCANGKIKVLKLLQPKLNKLLDNSINFNSNCLINAAESGSIETIQYLLNNGFIMDENIKFRMCYMLLTGGNGTPDVITWFQKNGIMPIDFINEDEL